MQDIYTKLYVAYGCVSKLTINAINGNLSSVSAFAEWFHQPIENTTKKKQKHNLKDIIKLQLYEKWFETYGSKHIDRGVDIQNET